MGELYFAKTWKVGKQFAHFPALREAFFLSQRILKNGSKNHENVAYFPYSLKNSSYCFVPKFGHFRPFCSSLIKSDKHFRGGPLDPLCTCTQEIVRLCPRPERPHMPGNA